MKNKQISFLPLAISRIRNLDQDGLKKEINRASAFLEKTRDSFLGVKSIDVRNSIKEVRYKVKAYVIDLQWAVDNFDKFQEEIVEFKKAENEAFRHRQREHRKRLAEKSAKDKLEKIFVGGLKPNTFRRLREGKSFKLHEDVIQRNHLLDKSLSAIKYVLFTIHRASKTFELKSITPDFEVVLGPQIIKDERTRD